ncbi:MAG: hypothetical protein IJC76_04455 [Lachnospiraceae bacterium]|nr:hypothetical protein [Lachnospiraceae bacterium]
MYQIIMKNEILHDKNCPYLELQGDKEMVIDDLVDWGKRYRCCKRCRRIVLVHNGIKDIRNIKNHEDYYNFFDRHKVSIEVLQELFVNKRAQINIVDGSMEIYCNKDTWRIPIKLKNGQAELLHNNYIRIFNGRRVIESDFHEQKLFKKTVERALKYIIEYDYEIYHNYPS